MSTGWVWNALSGPVCCTSKVLPRARHPQHSQHPEQQVGQVLALGARWVQRVVAARAAAAQQRHAPARDRRGLLRQCACAPQQTAVGTVPGRRTRSCGTRSWTSEAFFSLLTVLRVLPGCIRYCPSRQQQR
jgi:hypothetical protein